MCEPINDNDKRLVYYNPERVLAIFNTRKDARRALKRMLTETSLGGKFEIVKAEISEET